WATQIADARRHSLRRREPADGEPAGDDARLDDLGHEDDRGTQLSMFAALSAVVTGTDESSVFDVDEAVLDRLDRLDRQDAAGAGDAALDVTLPPLPGSSGNGGNGAAHDAVAGDSLPADPRQQRLELRERNAKLVQDLVWATGMGHAQVNGQLNRSVG